MQFDEAHTKAAAPSLTPLLRAGESLTLAVSTRMIASSESDYGRDRAKRHVQVLDDRLPAALAPHPNRPLRPAERLARGTATAAGIAVTAEYPTPNTDRALHGTAQSGAEGSASYRMAAGFDRKVLDRSGSNNFLVLTSDRVLLVRFAQPPRARVAVDAELRFEIPRGQVSAHRDRKLLNRRRLKLTFTDGSQITLGGQIGNPGIDRCCAELGAPAAA